jgi:hypothetical protein
MDLTNIIVWSRKSFIVSVVSWGSDFEQNLGWKPVTDPSSQHNFCGHWQEPQGHNKQEPTTLILLYGSNKHHCMDKEEFHWLCGVMPVWFWAKPGLKTSDGPLQPAQLLWPLTVPGDNKQEPTTVILPYGSNKHHCMDNEEFHWFCGVMGIWFWAKPGLKISDGPQLHSAQLLWPLTGEGTISVATDSPRGITNRNQPLSFFHMDLTNIIVWTRKSFIGSVVSCRSDFEKNLGWKPVIDDPSSRQNFCGHWQSQGHNKQEPTTLILPYGSKKHHCFGEEEFHWLCGVMGVWFWAKLGLKTSDGPQQSAQLLSPLKTTPGA